MMKNKPQRIISLLAVICFAVCCACAAHAAGDAVNPFDSDSDYKLKRIVIFSRHSIRAPLENNISKMKTITPHKWIDWSANPGELTEHGGVVETIFGQYFKSALEKIGFIPQNWVPEKDEVRFRANSLQRTIATARYFASGFLPCADIRVEHHNPIGEMDPEINPTLHFTGEEYCKQAKDYIAKHLGIKEQKEIYDRIRDGLRVLESVLDYQDSELAKETASEHFPAEKIDMSVTKESGVTASGDISLEVAAVDALSLQYLEGGESRLTAFGHTLTEKDAEELNKIIDTFYDAINAPYELAINTAHPVLIYLRDELLNNVRKFSFTCGHDSNLVPITSALRIEPYKLENVVGSNTVPIGSKLVFCVYDGPDGKEYAKLRMIYMSADQIRDRAQITVSDPPMTTELSFEGLKKNSDGYYLFDDVIARFNEAIDAYATLPGNTEEKSAAKAA